MNRHGQVFSRREGDKVGIFRPERNPEPEHLRVIALFDLKDVELDAGPIAFLVRLLDADRAQDGLSMVAVDVG